MFGRWPGWAPTPADACSGAPSEGSPPLLSEREVSAAIGTTAYGSDGDKLGTVDHFFLDDRTGAPTWVSVSTGLFGTRRSLIPAAEATFAEGALRLPVSRDAVRGAPDIGDDSHLGPADEEQLRRHYGVARAAGGGPVGRREAGGVLSS